MKNRSALAQPKSVCIEIKGLLVLASSETQSVLLLEQDNVLFLVLVQPRKCPDMTENWDVIKTSTQTKTNKKSQFLHICFFNDMSFFI